MKLRKDNAGCRFCNDEEFAVRHTLEDEVLTNMLAWAVDAAKRRHATGMTPNLNMMDRLEEILLHFRSLDDDTKQAQRAIKDLKAIERSLAK